jgi:hypothetical protein
MIKLLCRALVLAVIAYGPFAQAAFTGWVGVPLLGEDAPGGGCDPGDTGYVIAQDPIAGAESALGATVTLTIGPECSSGGGIDGIQNHLGIGIGVGI